MPLDHVFDDINKIRFMITNPPFINNDFLFKQILFSDICAAVLKPPNKFLKEHFMVFAKSSDNPRHLDIRSDITELTEMSPLEFSNTFFCNTEKGGLGYLELEWKVEKYKRKHGSLCGMVPERKESMSDPEEQYLEYLKRQRLNT